MFVSCTFISTVVYSRNFLHYNVEHVNWINFPANFIYELNKENVTIKYYIINVGII